MKAEGGASGDVPRQGFSPRLEEAFVLAHSLHRGQRRKGGAIPYITHLMAVAALVGEYGGSEDQVIAALLHDAAEDQGGEAVLRDIRRRFGDGVADLVDACSDTLEHPKPAWQARKERHVARVRASHPELRLIIAADKLHNGLTTLKDAWAYGDRVWDRFQTGREGTLWYYREMLAALREGWDHPILAALQQVTDHLHEAAGVAPDAMD